MGFRIFKKDSLYLVLLVVAVGGILLWQNYQFVEDKTELVFSKLKATIAPELSLSEDSGESQLILLEIQEKVNKIAIEVDRIDREVQELKAFTELQKEINEITILIINLNSKKK